MTDRLLITTQFQSQTRYVFACIIVAQSVGNVIRSDCLMKSVPPRGSGWVLASLGSQIRPTRDRVVVLTSSMTRYSSRPL